MELIDKLFYTSGLCLAVGFYIIRVAVDAPENVRLGAGVMFLLSVPMFIVLALMKIWA